MRDLLSDGDARLLSDGPRRSHSKSASNWTSLPGPQRGFFLSSTSSSVMSMQLVNALQGWGLLPAKWNAISSRGSSDLTRQYNNALSLKSKPPPQPSISVTTPQADRLADRQTDLQTDRQTDSQPDSQTDKQTDWQTNRLANRQTAEAERHLNYLGSPDINFLANAGETKPWR